MSAKLGLNDLHPAVADTLKARVWSMRVGHDARPEDAAARRVLTRRWKVGQRILAAVPIGAAVGAGIAAALGAHGGQLFGVGFMTAYFSAVGTGVGSLLLGKFGPSRSVSAEELRALSTGVEFGQPEAVYVETICALLEAGENVTEQTGREILASLNQLLEQASYVEERLDRLQKAASTESVHDLAEERDRLSERASEAADPQARADLNQSLVICDERLRNARALAPLIERLDAQREVIHQTMLSVQSSVSRLQIAPAAIAGPDVEDVKRVVSQVTAQTHAVEDAVQQVMSLRSQE